MRWTRRRFLGGSVAVACVGCSGDGTVSPSSSTGPTPRATGDDEVDNDASSSGELPARAGAVEAGLLSEVRVAAVPTYVPAARSYLVALTNDEVAALTDTADAMLLPGLEHGVLALAQKCPHLGCRVPFCDSSEWFECACHGAMFTRVGEHRDGPGPRGLDAHPVVVADGVVSVDVRTVIRGAPVGTVVVEQAASGPHCVGENSH